MPVQVRGHELPFHFRLGVRIDASLAMPANACDRARASRGSRGSAIVVPPAIAAATGAPIVAYRTCNVSPSNVIPSGTSRPPCGQPCLMTVPPARRHIRSSRARPQAAVGVGGVDVDRKSGTHVKRRVGLAQVDRPRPADEPEHRRRLLARGHPIYERLVQPHQLPPAVAGDVGGVTRRGRRRPGRAAT